MENELSTEVIFDVNYQPSVIEIVNEDQLATLINATVQRFEGLIFKEDDIADAKKARTELNRIFDLIDSKRKEVKKQFSEPLVAFESQIKGYSDEIKRMSKNINDQIREFEAKKKEEYKTIVLAYLEKQAQKHGVDTNQITLRSNWLNSTSFTAKNKLTKKIEEEIIAECIAVKQQKENIEQQKILVESYVKAYGLDPFSWISLVDEGLTAAQIFPKIDQAVKELREKEAKELEIAEQEIKQTVNEETNVESLQELLTKEQTFSFTLHITGTAKQLSIIKNTIEKLNVEYKVETEE
ncbi:DUF1351 domain-containing protein [Enterococcus hirae]|uniref:DUF1351 domain-containing protein n=1 Tax=Enterococcus TaxID=1350 RepID=UPI001597FD4D|nr:DUF1351 domain-containing protein [Enterococcus hirae]EMF0097239.1 DUF1351 domain-containing protein [Enterococcus hirae]EMF0128742.1 DUF1351 domain-containing protein [Enterococcus hirae]EMF0206926.1 DUF1351 domain-containing protein [Enterococcus hirae]EMF0220197.1 DUF1351 domain-containing protein [Enterococcus hirae]EMF0226184.1 DUF1351 domain-containing protein [Enterococcus hirae]